jgi:SAM-dependent methyltransferase
VLGEGAGSIARWPADRFGEVLAVDIDARFLDPSWPPNLPRRRHLPYHDQQTGPAGSGDLSERCRMTQEPVMADRYSRGVLSHDIPSELRRLQLLEEQLDPTTTAVLEARNLPPTARCLTLGAGAGSISRWLAERFAEVGAVDIDARYLDPSWAPNLSIQEADVRTLELPPASFDLIHARALFMHLPDREQILAKAAGWLAPGGWMVIEDLANTPADRQHPDWHELVRAVGSLVEGQGADLNWAKRRQPQVLAEIGLTDVGVQAAVLTAGGDTPTGRLWRVFAAQVGQVLIDRGRLTADQIEAALALLDDPSFSSPSETMISAWGRAS